MNATALVRKTQVQIPQNGDECELASLVHRQLTLLGEDPGREGLLRTPERVAKSLDWLTRGYRENVNEVVNGARRCRGVL